jgi:hypothetical protein
MVIFQLDDIVKLVGPHLVEGLVWSRPINFLLIKDCGHQIIVWPLKRVENLAIEIYIINLLDI